MFSIYVRPLGTFVFVKQVRRSISLQVEVAQKVFTISLPHIGANSNALPLLQIQFYLLSLCCTLILVFECIVSVWVVINPSISGSFSPYQCSQPSRADGRALADYSPGRPGQGGYGRPGKASVFHKDGSPMG